MKAFIQEKVQLLTKLTPRKAWNASAVLFSYYLSRLVKRPIQMGLPISISVEPTTSCNLRCPECPSGKRDFTRPTGMLQETTFYNLIDEVKSHLLYLTFYFQGEPYLHPQFTELVYYASKKGIYTSTSTNAHYLSEENARKTVLSGLDRLIISIDGSTQETYESYRVGGNLSKVIEGAKTIVRIKKELNSSKPLLVFQFLVVKPNEHQIKEIYRIANEIGIDQVKLKTAQIYDFENGNPLIPDNKRFSRYRQKKDGRFEIKNELLNHCWKLWHSSVVTWDGIVVPCCFDKDAKHQFGNIADGGFELVWQNGKYKSFRSALLKSRKQIDICTNCTEGTKVWTQDDE